MPDTQKPGSPDSLRAEYWCGLRIVAANGFARIAKGFARRRLNAGGHNAIQSKDSILFPAASIRHSNG